MLNAVLLITDLFLLNNSFLYIDPNAGAAAIGIVIAALAGVGMTLKLYWVKLKLKLFDKK
jgi:hypothetical protein